MLCWDEKLDELLFAVLPGSEQLRLQHTRAMEAPSAFVFERAVLQHGGKFVPSC